MTTSTQCINFVTGFFSASTLLLCWSSLASPATAVQPSIRVMGQHTQQLFLAQAAPPCTSLPRLCPTRPSARRMFQGQTHLSPKGLREAQESWNSHIDPRSQPKNTNKSQLHWLLVPLLRLKPGSFHVRLAFPHQFIQQVWKLGMERFSFSFSSMLQLKCSNEGLTTVWLWASSWGGASQQGLKWARSLCPANTPAAWGVRCSCSTGWTSLPLFLG